MSPCKTFKRHILKLMDFNRNDLTDQELITLYEQLLLPRMIEEKMLILLRQNKISKWFSGIGQEAIAVGVAAALNPDEYILTMHRNLGVFTVRGMPLRRLFAQWQGTPNGYTKGRDRSFHFGSHEHHIVGMISHLGPQNGIATGIALAARLKNEAKVTVVFNGDGATSEGDFHEAVNLAAVWDLPVIFIIENNGYGLSTPNREQFRCERLADKASGYGIEGIRIDGNNILEVYNTMRGLARSMRQNPRPVLVECMTFRMRGHEEASGTRYVPAGLFDEWHSKDPIDNYQAFLLEQKIIDEGVIKSLREKAKREIDAEMKAFEELPAEADTGNELADVYAPSPSSPDEPEPATEQFPTIRYIDSISEGLRQSMERFPQLVLMGQDIGEYGGVFKVTEGLMGRFGEHRVRNTPLCEAAVVGAALGLSIRGMKAMVEMQFADFVTEGFNQIVNNLAKIHWRWGQAADVVIRMPTGAGTAAGPFHSQSTESWFFHTPGLKIVYPSNPADAKGLLCAAFEDPNPVLFFEHKFLYRSLSGPVAPDYYTIAIGKAEVTRKGSDLSIITYGMGVHWAMEIVEEMRVDAEILDLRTLLPWDKDAVATTVKKTNRVLVLHEDTLTGGIGAEIAAWLAGNCFNFLDAPIKRVASLDTPVPFAPPLEQNFLPKGRLRAEIEELLKY